MTASTFPLQLVGCLNSTELKEVLQAYEDAKAVHPYDVDLELEYKKYTPRQLMQLYKSQYHVSSKSALPIDHIYMNGGIRHPRNEQIRIENGVSFEVDEPDDLGITLFTLNALYKFLQDKGTQINEDRTPFSLSTITQVMLLGFLCGANNCQGLEKFYLTKYLKLKFMVPGLPDPKYLFTANTARTVMNILNRSSLENVYKEYARLMRNCIMAVKKGKGMNRPDRGDVQKELLYYNNTFVGDCFVTCHNVDYSFTLMQHVVDTGAGFISTVKYEPFLNEKQDTIDRVFTKDRERNHPAALVIDKTETVEGQELSRHVEILPTVMLPEADFKAPDVKNIIRYVRQYGEERPQVIYFLTNFDYRSVDDAEMLRFSFEHFWARESLAEELDFTFMVFDEYYDIKDYSLYMDETWLVPHRQCWDDVIYNLMTYARTALARETDHRARVKYKTMIERMDWDMPAAVRYYWMFWLDNGTDWSARPHNVLSFFTTKFTDD